MYILKNKHTSVSNIVKAKANINARANTMAKKIGASRAGFLVLPHETSIASVIRGGVGYPAAGLYQGIFKLAELEGVAFLDGFAAVSRRAEA